MQSSIILVDNSGDIVEISDFKPFGIIGYNSVITDLDNNYKFTGHEHDDETDLEYMKARYYDASIARFSSIDPMTIYNPFSFIGDPQQLNSYSYARNNPLIFIDPTGLYNTKTGQVEEGDTSESVVNSINDTFGIKTDWKTVQEVSFYNDRFGDKSLDRIIGESLYIGTDITADITSRLDMLNISRSILANLLGGQSLMLFAPNMPWDIKNSSDSILGGGLDRQFKSYIYNDKFIRYDAPGNINYGYVANSLNLPNKVIQGGAVIEQFVSNLFKSNLTTLSDNGGDSGHIQTGVNSNNKDRSFLRSIFKW